MVVVRWQYSFRVEVRIVRLVDVVVGWEDYLQEWCSEVLEPVVLPQARIRSAPTSTYFWVNEIIFFK